MKLGLYVVVSLLIILTNSRDLCLADESETTLPSLVTFSFTATVIEVNGNTKLEVAVGDQVHGSFSYLPGKVIESYQEPPAGLTFQFNRLIFETIEDIYRKHNKAYLVHIIKSPKQAQNPQQTLHIYAECSHDRQVYQHQMSVRADLELITNLTTTFGETHFLTLSSQTI